MWTRMLVIAALAAPMLVACEDKEQVAARAAADSMAALRKQGEFDLSNPEMGAKVLIKLHDTQIEVSHTEIPKGQVTFAVENHGTQPHVLEIKGKAGDWKSMPLRPKETVLMAMLMEPGTYELFCPDSSGVHQKRGMRGKIVVN